MYICVGHETKILIKKKKKRIQDLHEESPECITNLYSKYQKTLIKERREAPPQEGSAVLIMGHQGDEMIKAGISGELPHQHTVVPIPAAPGRSSGITKS